MKDDNSKNIPKRKGSDEATLHSCAVYLCIVWNETEVANEKGRLSNSYKGYLFRYIKKCQTFPKRKDIPDKILDSARIIQCSIVRFFVYVPFAFS